MVLNYQIWSRPLHCWLSSHRSLSADESSPCCVLVQCSASNRFQHRQLWLANFFIIIRSSVARRSVLLTTLKPNIDRVSDSSWAVIAEGRNDKSTCLLASVLIVPVLNKRVYRGFESIIGSIYNFWFASHCFARLNNVLRPFLNDYHNLFLIATVILISWMIWHGHRGYVSIEITCHLVSTSLFTAWLFYLRERPWQTHLTLLGPSNS